MIFSRTAFVVQLLLSGIASSQASSSVENTPCSGFGCANDSDNGADDDEPCTGFGCHEESPSRDEEYLECTPVTLRMTTNGPPEDIRFDLVCNDAPVWAYPSETLPIDQVSAGISISACIFENTCCDFTIHDDASNGGLQQGQTSFLLLQSQGQELLKYDSLTSSPFAILSKTFGQSCPNGYSTSATKECTADLETSVHFAITLDDHPEELSWYLVCDDSSSSDANAQDSLTTIWDVPRASLSDAYSTVEQEACVPSGSACAFSIVDSQGDGLTSGGFSLTYGNHIIGSYDSNGDNEGFNDMSFCVGHSCEQKSVLGALSDSVRTVETILQGIEQNENEDEPNFDPLYDIKQKMKDLASKIEARWNGQQDGNGVVSNAVKESASASSGMEAWSYALVVIACVAVTLLAFFSFSICRRPVSPNVSPSDPVKRGDIEDDDRTVSMDEEEASLEASLEASA